MEMVYANLGTLSGLCLLLLAMGLTLGLRPLPELPWVRPWLASFWVAALTILALSLPLALPILHVAPLRIRTFAVLNSGFFLAAGLQALGWLRIRWRKVPLWLVFIPQGIYVILFFAVGGEHNALARVVLFSALEALVHGVTAYWAYQGLLRISPHLTKVATGMIALHALFYLGRTGLALLLPVEGDYSISVAVAVMEGLIYNIVIAYLQWLILTEEG